MANSSSLEEIDFFWDPMCPWAWMVSRWVTDVAKVTNLKVNWRFFSLRILNQQEDYTIAPGYNEVVKPGAESRVRHTRSLRLLRVAAAAQDQYGPSMAGQLYTVLGTMIHQELIMEAFDDGDSGALQTALQRAGADESLAAAAEVEDWDEIVGGDTNIAMERVKADVGTPIITFAPPDGPSLFGPVLSRRPPTDRSLDLWHAVRTLAYEPSFSELKRKRPRRSLFAAAVDDFGSNEIRDEPADTCAVER
jgi:hypothetical protein